MIEKKQPVQQQQRQPYPNDWAFVSPSRDHPAVANQQQPTDEHVAQQQQQQVQL